MDSVTTSVHYARHLEVASRDGTATSPTVNSMSCEPSRRRLLAVADAIVKHPGVTLLVTIVLWVIDHLIDYLRQW